MARERKDHVQPVAIRGLCRVAAVAWVVAIGAAPESTSHAQLGAPAKTDDVVQMTARLLEKNHFLQQNIDDEVSRRLLTRYTDTLDYFHILFTEGDMAEFDRYATTLDDALNAGDSSPAFEIYARFLKRQEERLAHVGQLLASPDSFDFTRDEAFVADRHKLPRPKDLEEAKALWRLRLKYDILQERLGEKKKKPESQEVADLLRRRYERNLRYDKERTPEEITAIFLTSLAHVYDPHSDYMSSEELENFAINMQLKLFGIGAVLASEDGYCTIKKLIPGGPAERSKQVRPNDRIIRVAQGDGEPVDVVEMSLNKVVDMIRGPKDTEVRLTILPEDSADGERKEVALIRDEIKLEDQRASAKVIDVPGAGGSACRMALIDLPSFYSPMDVGDNGGSGESTTADVARLLGKLQMEGVEGVVLDLRRNGGGSLDEAINLAGLFIPEGPVVQVRDVRGRRIVHADEDGEVCYPGPLVLLTSRFSASASEIVAGALQDYGRAVIVGDSSTHGKGTVQSLIELGPLMRRAIQFWSRPLPSRPGALKLTVQKYYRASGSSTQLNGVRPDVILPSITDFSEFGEASLDNPLPWDEISPAPYTPTGSVDQIVPLLRAKSENRVATDPEFAYIANDIDRRKKLLEDKNVSLNEAVRRAERDEIEKELKARKEERAARRAKAPQEAVRLLPMTKVDSPGLPDAEAYQEPKEDVAVSGLVEEEEEETDEGKGPYLDPSARESLYILRDFIQLRAAAQHKESIAAAAREGSQPLTPAQPR